MGTTDALPQPGHDDEVVTTVPDEDAARPVVEALLLAGIGPGLRPVSGGVQVTVVRGDGARARRALGMEEEDAAPEAPGAAASWPSDGVALTPGAAAARAAAPAGPTAPAADPTARAARADGSEGDVPAAPSSRRTTLVYLGVFLLALVLIPALAFFISFKAAGG